MSCVFCSYISNKEYLVENELAFAIFDNYPVNKGHVLVMPKRHYASYFDATASEVEALNDLIKKVKELLENEFKPDGYNIGINVGEAAGQTIFHLHIHVIPRYSGDVENPRGVLENLKSLLWSMMAKKR